MSESSIYQKTLKSKFYIEQNFVNDKEVTGVFRQYHYNNELKSSEIIQAYKQYGNFINSYSLFKNRRCVERGDCSNLEFLPSNEQEDPTLYQIQIKSNSTFDSSETNFSNFVVRYNLKNEGDVFCYNRKKKFQSIVIKAMPLVRRAQVNTSNEQTIYYSFGNKISFLGRAKGIFLPENQNIWIITSANGSTYDRFGNSIYSGSFERKESQDIFLKDGLYKSYDQNVLQKASRYYEGKIKGYVKYYHSNGKLSKICKEDTVLGDESDKKDFLGSHGEYVQMFGKSGSYEYFGSLKNDLFSGYGIIFDSDRPSKRGIFIDNKLNDECAFIFDNVGRLEYFGNVTLNVIYGSGITFNYFGNTRRVIDMNKKLVDQEDHKKIKDQSKRLKTNKKRNNSRLKVSIPKKRNSNVASELNDLNIAALTKSNCFETLSKQESFNYDALVCSGTFEIETPKNIRNSSFTKTVSNSNKKNDVKEKNPSETKRMLTGSQKKLDSTTESPTKSLFNVIKKPEKNKGKTPNIERRNPSNNKKAPHKGSGTSDPVQKDSQENSARKSKNYFNNTIPKSSPNKAFKKTNTFTKEANTFSNQSNKDIDQFHNLQYKKCETVSEYNDETMSFITEYSQRDINFPNKKDMNQSDSKGSDKNIVNNELFLMQTSSQKESWKVSTILPDANNDSIFGKDSLFESKASEIFTQQQPKWMDKSMVNEEKERILNIKKTEINVEEKSPLLKDMNSPSKELAKNQVPVKRFVKRKLQSKNSSNSKDKKKPQTKIIELDSPQIARRDSLKNFDRQESIASNQYKEEYIKDFRYEEDPRLNKNVKELFIDGEVYDVVWELDKNEKGFNDDGKFKNVKATQIIELPDISTWEKWGEDDSKSIVVTWIGFCISNNEEYDLVFDNLQFDLKGKITGSGEDDLGSFVVSGNFRPNSCVVEFIKQYNAGHSVFYTGNITEGKIVGTWTQFDSTEKQKKEYFELEMGKDIEFTGYTKNSYLDDEEITLDLVIQGTSVYGFGFDSLCDQSFFIMGDYNKNNGYINFFKKYFVKPKFGTDFIESKQDVLLYVGRMYFDSLKDKFVIDGFLQFPDNVIEQRVFHIKANREIPDSPEDETLTAPKKGKYILSKMRKGSFGDKSRNNMPQDCKLYKKGDIILKGTGKIQDEKIVGKCILFSDNIKSTNLFVKKSEIEYNMAGKKTGKGIVYMVSNDIASTKRVAIGLSSKFPYEVRAPKDYIEQYYLNGKPNGQFRLYKFNFPEDKCPSLLIIGKKENGKPVGFYKVYEYGKLVEMGDAKNFVKHNDIEAYDYLLNRINNSEEFCIRYNQKHNSVMYRNFSSYHFAFIEDAQWKMLKIGEEMFDYDSMFLFNHKKSNQLSFYGTASWCLGDKGIQVKCSDGVNYDRFGRVKFMGFCETDIDNKSSQLDGYFRDFYDTDYTGLKSVGYIENGVKRQLRKVYHPNGKLAHIAYEIREHQATKNDQSKTSQTNTTKSEITGYSEIYGPFCAVYDKFGMFKYMGGIENTTLSGKGSVVWDFNCCKVKKGLSRNIDLPLWTLYPKNEAQKYSKVNYRSHFGHSSASLNTSTIRKFNRSSSRSMRNSMISSEFWG